MKAFVIAVVAGAGISAVAYYGLNAVGWTATEKYQISDNVRLD